MPAKLFAPIRLRPHIPRPPLRQRVRAWWLNKRRRWLESRIRWVGWNAVLSLALDRILEAQRRNGGGHE